jgi:hypothetical protein
MSWSFSCFKGAVMKVRRPVITSNLLARGALWGIVLLAVISTFSLASASSNESDDTDSLPDAPQAGGVKNLVLVKLPVFELSLKPEADIGNKDVVVTKVAFNPSLPNGVNEILKSYDVFALAIKAVKNGSPDQAWNNLITSTQQNCPSLNTNGMVSLLYYYGLNLLENYNWNGTWAPTSLNTVAEGIGEKEGNAGVCRDIHTAMAEIASACGLKNAGGLFLNWQDSYGVEDPHAVAYYQDPKTGQYIVLNYYTMYNTGTKSLPQAADIAAQQFSPTSMVAYAATNLTKNTSMHEIATTRGSAMMGTINNASDLSKSRPPLEISIGNLNISASAKAHHSLGDGYTVGVYGAMDDNQESGALFGSAGAMIAKETQVQISDKVDMNSNSQVTMGVFDIHDEDFLNRIRNAFEGIILIRSDNSVAWHTEHNPGSVTASFHAADNYTDHFVGVPYNFLSIKLAVDPTQYARVHAQTTEIITTRTIQNTEIVMARADDAAGVALKKDFKPVSVNSDSTLHLLGGAGHGVTGEEENAKVVFKTRAGSLSTGADALIVQNRSKDYFYNLPVYCKAKVEYDKTIKGIDIQASGDYRCNHDSKLSVPGEQPLDKDNWEINQPRDTVGLKITWGGKGKTVEN